MRIVGKVLFTAAVLFACWLDEQFWTSVVMQTLLVLVLAIVWFDRWFKRVIGGIFSRD